MPWHTLLGPVQRRPAAALDDWFDALLDECPAASPLELAIGGGRRASTPGLAFLAGYQAALRALWPAAPAGLGAFCATEGRQLRPAQLRTRLDGRHLDGEKDFVTAGPAAQWLLVPARDEAPGAAAHLAVAVVRVGDPGVRLLPGPPLSLIPDIPHARLRLEHAPCERLAGDGWDDYVKPFRTHEDLYVLAALVAWLYGLALEQHWPGELPLRLVGLLSGVAEAARQPAGAAATHLLLAGLEAQRRALEPEVATALAAGSPELGQLWLRDRGLLLMAGEARTRRLDKALAELGIDLHQ
ncbi:acyl-CoA dehydrogenase middle domain-containing protein [Stutzerimonas azotifigens]|uniref:acyl-CoA dehydrogenase n=1 Tax=Stutzerimonas azotifigens TaxID=291995 RepID=UPI0003FF0CC3|nr:acyl-CoA dehydrogenase [Stutzerimonas azotifigens]